MITVVGLGFVGLTTALGFASKGKRVYGFDVDEARMRDLKNRRIPFFEPHLQEVLQDVCDNYFFLPDSLEAAVNNSEVIFICVGTPATPDGSADLSFIFTAVEQIVKASKSGFKVLVIKSTVPPSTLARKVKPFLDHEAGERKTFFGIASNPEFLREGYAWDDFINPDRIVLGVEEEASAEILTNLYSVFPVPVHVVHPNTAEFIKYLSNTLLSTMISFANEMAMIAHRIGDINVEKAFTILHHDKRWFGHPALMAKYVYPGCGYGGYCLPKDTAALEALARQYQYDAVMLRANLDTNHNVKEFVVESITGQCGQEETIGILGLAFKPQSDDVRLSPSRDIIEQLLSKGYGNVVAYDPVANDAFHGAYQLPVAYASSLEEIITRASVLVLLTGWPEFIHSEALRVHRRLLDFRYVISGRSPQEFEPAIL